jgi:hypothetical protein
MLLEVKASSARATSGSRALAKAAGDRIAEHRADRRLRQSRSRCRCPSPNVRRAMTIAPKARVLDIDVYVPGRSEAAVRRARSSCRRTSRRSGRAQSVALTKRRTFARRSILKAPRAILREAIAAHFQIAGRLHRLRQRLGRDSAPDRQLLRASRLTRSFQRSTRSRSTRSRLTRTARRPSKCRSPSSCSMWMAL